jgi:integral membrane protein (TIGR01906 family)
MNTKMKYIDLITRWLFILCIPILLFTGFIAIAINSQWLYEHSFNTYDVGQTTGLEPAELEKAAGEIITYFNSPEEFLSVTVIKDGVDFVLFNEKEVAHMKDVKALIWLDYYVLIGIGIYVLAYIGVNIFLRQKEHHHRLALSAIYGSGLTLGLILLLGIIAATNFNAFFTAFHLISFANDFWLLDPNTDYLIMMFPGGFWEDCVIFLAVAIAGTAAIAGIASWLYLKRGKSGN